MPSETFYCPHCKRQLTKSAQAFVLGEMFRKKSGFIGLGEPPLDVTCPGSRGRIDSMKMIKEEYDIDSGIKKMFPFMGGVSLQLFFYSGFQSTGHGLSPSLPG